MSNAARSVRFMPVPEVLLEKNSIVLIKTYLAMQNWSGKNTSSLLPILSEEIGCHKKSIYAALMTMEEMGITWRIEKETDTDRRGRWWYDQWHLHDEYNVKKVQRKRRG